VTKSVVTESPNVEHENTTAVKSSSTIPLKLHEGSTTKNTPHPKRIPLAESTAARRLSMTQRNAALGSLLNLRLGHVSRFAPTQDHFLRLAVWSKVPRRV
jgi:hypothetical protein